MPGLLDALRGDIPPNLLDLVPEAQRQGVLDQASSNYWRGFLATPRGSGILSRFGNADQAASNTVKDYLAVVGEAARVAEGQRKAQNQSLLGDAVRNAIEVAPGTGVGTADPRFLPRNTDGTEQAGPGYIPPVQRFNYQRFAANPNVARALSSDPNTLEKLFGPQMEFVNGMAVDKRNVAPGTFIPKLSENMEPVGVDPKTNRTVYAPVQGGTQAVGALKGAEASAQENAKANFDLVPLTLPSAVTLPNGTVLPAGTVVNVTRSQQLNAARSGQPFVQSLAPGVKTEMENIGKFNVENVLAPAKAKFDVAETANKQLAVMGQLVANTNINQITGNDTVMKLAGYAKAAGWLTPEAASGVTNLSTLRGQLSGVVLNDQLAQKGPQTEADAKRMEGTLNGLNDKDATLFLINTRRAQNNVAQDYYRFLNEYRDKNGTLTGADVAWNNARGKESLFRQPEMKKYAPIYEIEGKRYRVYGDGGKPELVQ